MDAVSHPLDSQTSSDSQKINHQTTNELKNHQRFISTLQGGDAVSGCCAPKIVGIKTGSLDSPISTSVHHSINTHFINIDISMIIYSYVFLHIIPTWLVKAEK